MPVITKSTYKILLFALISFFSCGEATHQSKKQVENDMELYNTFDTSNHLQPEFDKNQFDTLHNWDFGWAILKPINVAPDNKKEIELSKRLSPGQKALYFFWYVDAEVTNGGFIQFYWNGYKMYLPPIKDGLKLIGDSVMLDIVEASDNEYIANKADFEKQREKNDWGPLYKNLKRFEELDKMFYKSHNHTMALIEKYARQYPKEFVKLN